MRLVDHDPCRPWEGHSDRSWGQFGRSIAVGIDAVGCSDHRKFACSVGKLGSARTRRFEEVEGLESRCESGQHDNTHAGIGERLLVTGVSLRI